MRFVLFPFFLSCALPRAAEAGFAPLFPDRGPLIRWHAAEWSDLARTAPQGVAWSVADGELRSPEERGTWLVSDAAFGDFELRFEILLTARGNSGVALRAPAAGDPAFDGLEFQIADARYNLEATDSELTAGLYRALAPRAQVYRPEAWNEVRIRLQGSRLRAVLNRVLVQDADLAQFGDPVPRHDGSPAPPLRDRPRAGRIGFQHLSRDGMVRIRNARLRVLGPDETDEEEWIWRGRCRAYAGDYTGAIAEFTRGLAAFPDSPRLLRHRGHRYLTTRRFDLAERDLARASVLIRGTPDEIEPDGIPNAAGIPRSTNHSNVGYHHGLALYLQGRYAEAAEAYCRCLAHARVNDDMLCATLYWLHNALLRDGHPEQARAALDEVREKMDILENHAYHELLLLFRGLLTPEQILAAHLPGSLEHATRAYGVALHHLAAGHLAEARELCSAIVGADPAASFGFLAAEADLARLGR